MLPNHNSTSVAALRVYANESLPKYVRSNGIQRILNA